jgi:endo-1,4-beta-xylanase
VHPEPERFDFAAADGLAQFAKTHGLLFRGHNLVWHNSLPDWFKATATPQTARQILVDHIQTVVSRYAGQMHSWDVVNEAILPADGRADGLRQTPWLELIGPDYIDLAFRTAAAADPTALLVYNDFELDYDRPQDEAKRTALLRFLERLKQQNLPIQALGMQAHLWGGETRFNASKLSRWLESVASLGLKILVTELDVTDKALPPDQLIRDQIVAGAYADYLAVLLEQPAVIAVLTWGLSDRYSWLAEFAPRSDGEPVRPLPLDHNLERKLAWNAMAQAFDQAPNRPVRMEQTRGRL